MALKIKVTLIRSGLNRPETPNRTAMTLVTRHSVLDPLQSPIYTDVVVVCVTVRVTRDHTRIGGTMSAATLTKPRRPQLDRHPEGARRAAGRSRAWGAHAATTASGSPSTRAT